MKVENLITILLFCILLLIYKHVKDYETVFIYFAWAIGFFTPQYKHLVKKEENENL